MFLVRISVFLQELFHFSYIHLQDLDIGKALDGTYQVVLVVRNLPANVGNVRGQGSFPELGRSSGGGHGNPHRHSCLETAMDRGAWQATVYIVAKSQM